MKISIIIPVYNEIETIKKIIEEVYAADLGAEGIEREVIVVDDASDDGTRDIIRNLDKPNLKKVFHEYNRGKGAAVSSGLKEAEGDIIIIQDADLEYPPRDNFKILLEPIIKGYADVVYGSRFLGVHRVFMFWHYLANKFLILLTNLLYNTMLSDMETGAKAFKTEVIKAITITSQKFNIEPEITAKVFKKGYKVQEVPIVYCGRTYKEGKKIGFLDFIEAVWALIKYRFVD